MSIEQAMIARARPHMLAERARMLVREEASKGCRPEIANQPVALAPVYQPILAGAQAAIGDGPACGLYDALIPEREYMRLQFWISPEQRCDWNRSELFLKQLSCMRHRAAFEIVGNREKIRLQLLCHRGDEPVVRAAFVGQFEQCELSELERDVLRRIPSSAWATVMFRDFYPPPPYSHLLTRPDELQRSPYATVIGALASLPPSVTGFYQVVFAPVRPEHNWHQNVQALKDLEFTVKLMAGLPSAQRYAQQAPSFDLRNMAADVEVKAHSDKPFFFAALRIGVIGVQNQSDRFVQALGSVASLFQHGGRPLGYLSEAQYNTHLSHEQTQAMFLQGLVHRPGFLVNSWELTSLVHLPPPEIAEPHESALEPLETLPPDESLSKGTPIGYSLYAGKRRCVCIPAEIRNTHAHLIGRPRMGKSTMLEHMILHEAQQGHGMAVLDPHGRLVQRVLALLPESCADRVVYIDPGDSEWVPIWNPLLCSTGPGPGRLSDEMVGAFKSFVTGWGDRMEHMLRHALYALLHLPQASLLDVTNLLRHKSNESHQLRPVLLKALDNELAKSFWRQDFDRYSSADVSPAQHKLSKLLTSDTVSLMLSQTESSFDLRDIMESGKILLIDLSTVGPEVREFLGCFILALLHLAALSRSAVTSESIPPFHIYCDEAHKFLTDAMEDLIAETRKFNVSLTLAHQYMAQFSARKSGALSSVGSAVIFNVDTKDAQYLKKDLQSKVEAEDIITLDVGQAIARIGTQVVRFRTEAPLTIPEDHCRDQIIAMCRERYYKPVAHVRRAIRERRGWGDGLEEPDLQPNAPRDGGEEDASHATGGSLGLAARAFDDADFKYDVL